MNSRLHFSYLKNMLMNNLIRLLCVFGLLLSVTFAESPDETRKKAEAGDAIAQHRLGLTYYEGKGVIKDATEAAKWIRASAEQGYAEAQAYLGHMYRKGDGVIRDAAESAKWIRASAEGGYAVAQYNLAVMYEEGFHGVIKRDIVEAHAWYNLASSGGDRNAKEVLGDIEKEMTREQIYEATSLAKIYFAKLPKTK